MEADLDLADSLKTSDGELSGDQLMLEQYSSERKTLHVQKSYNNLLYTSSINDLKSKSIIDPVLHRPTTPGQLRQSIVAFTVDSLANSLAVGDIFHHHNQTNGHQPMFTATSTTSFLSKKSLSASVAPASKTKTSVKLTKTSMSITRPKSSQRLSSTDQQTKQMTPVLAFGSSDDALDRSIPTITSTKVTPPMKFSFGEPPRSNSSASIRSSSSSTLDSSHGTVANSKTKKT